MKIYYSTTFMACCRLLRVVLLLLMTSQLVKAQKMSYIGIEQGLSNNTVTTIYKDRTGFMWFGTLDGLNRFDGYSFKIFRNKFNDRNSLPDDIVNAIASDDKGNIWVGTQNGVAVLDDKTLVFSKIEYLDSLKKKKELNNWIYDVKSGTEGQMYIGATNAGFCIFDAEKNIAEAVPLSISSAGRLFNYTVNAIVVLNNEKVYLAVEKYGFCVYDRVSKQVRPLVAHLPTVSCIKADGTGHLWLATRVGFFDFLPGENTIRKIEFGEKNLNDCWFTNMLVDHNNTIWATTDGYGIVKFNINHPEKFRIINQENSGSLSSNAVYSIFEDELSRKWIGTLRGGIEVIDNDKYQFRTYVHEQLNKNSLVYNFTFSFAEDMRHDVWIGTDGGGLSIWNTKDGTFRNNPFFTSTGGLTNNFHISGILRGKDNSMWLSSYGAGVFRFDDKSKLLEPVPFFTTARHTAIWRIYEDRRQDIWASCLVGLAAGNEHKRLYKFNRNSRHFEPAAFSVTSDVLCIADDAGKGLWLGTFSGLLHVDPQKGIDKELDLKTAARSLLTSSNGKLWIGTYGRGVFVLFPDGRLVNYNEDNGLCNNKVLNIQEDNQGNLWFSTYNGLSKLNPRTGHIESFYAADGLQSNQFYYNASAKLSDGRLIFGGIKGFSVFSPDSIKTFHDFPKLVLTSLRVDNTEITAQDGFIKDSRNLFTTEHVVLPYEKATLSFDYVALEFSQPQKIQYAYKLEGRDSHWNYVNNTRTINYARLSEGGYMMRIRSTNASGIWNTRERTVNIIVLPPWYRTWWAYITYLGLSILSIYAYLYYHRKQTSLEYEVKLTKELSEKKISFFTNISHELRTPLTLIVNPIKDLLHNNGKNTDVVDISSIYRNSRRLLSLVDQLLLFRASESEVSELKPSRLKLKDVCYEIFLCFNNQVREKGINYSFLCVEEDLEVFADREKLEIALFNLLSNAIKYTESGGLVSVKLEKIPNSFLIHVSDTGHGIPAGTGDKLFEKFYRVSNPDQANEQSGFGIGLFLARRYMELQHGTLTYDSSPGKGTVFTIHLPASNEHKLTMGNTGTKITTRPILRELMADTQELEISKSPAQLAHVNEVLGGVVNEKPTILLIDDDKEIRGYIKSLLNESYTVFEAADTETGFQMILEKEPDIIVCDVVMKGLSGVDFCSKMKESPTFSHIPIILLTGTSSPEIKLKGIECGADDYITKPFENELLLARIKSMLKRRDTLKDYFFNEVTLQSNNLKIHPEYSDFLNKCIAIIENHLEDEDFSIKVFTEEIGMSRSKLFRKIKSISGLSNTEFIRYIRLRKAAQMMITTDLQIKEIAFQIGFQDIKYFREQFFKLFQMNPSDFVRKYRNNFNKNFNLNNTLVNQKNK